MINIFFFLISILNSFFSYKLFFNEINKKTFIEKYLHDQDRNVYFLGFIYESFCSIKLLTSDLCDLKGYSTEGKKIKSTLSSCPIIYIIFATLKCYIEHYSFDHHFGASYFFFCCKFKSDVSLSYLCSIELYLLYHHFVTSIHSNTIYEIKSFTCLVNIFEKD